MIMNIVMLIMNTLMTEAIAIFSGGEMSYAREKCDRKGENKFVLGSHTYVKRLSLNTRILIFPMDSPNDLTS